MGYVENNLITGESVTYQARFHWSAFLLPLLGGATTILFGVGMIVWSFGQHQDSIPRGTIGAVLLLVGGGVELSALIRRAAGEFAVTNKRVILKVGSVRRRTTEMFLNKIESVGVDQTVLGRVFRYGTIVLHGTGGSSEPFHTISDPLEFRRQVHEQIGKMSS